MYIWERGIFKYLCKIVEQRPSDIWRENTKYEIVWQKCQETIENLFHKSSHSKNSPLPNMSFIGYVCNDHKLHDIFSLYKFCTICLTKPKTLSMMNWLIQLVSIVLISFLSMYVYTVYISGNGHRFPLVAISIFSVKSVEWRNSNGEHI